MSLNDSNAHEEEDELTIDSDGFIVIERDPLFLDFDAAAGATGVPAEVLRQSAQRQADKLAQAASAVATTTS